MFIFVFFHVASVPLHVYYFLLHVCMVVLIKNSIRFLHTDFYYFSYKTQVTNLTAASATTGSFVVATIFSITFYFILKKLLKRRQQPILPTMSMRSLDEQDRQTEGTGEGSDGSPTPTPSQSTPTPTQRKNVLI